MRRVEMRCQLFHNRGYQYSDFSFPLLASSLSFANVSVPVILLSPLFFQWTDFGTLTHVEMAIGRHSAHQIREEPYVCGSGVASQSFPSTTNAKALCIHPALKLLPAGLQLPFMIMSPHWVWGTKGYLTHAQMGVDCWMFCSCCCDVCGVVCRPWRGSLCPVDSECYIQAYGCASFSPFQTFSVFSVHLMSQISSSLT